MQRIAEADPLSVNAAAGLSWLFFAAHRHDEAIRQAGKAIEIDPAFASAYAYLSFAYVAKGQFAAAIDASEKAASLTDHPFFRYGNTGWVYGLAGRRQDALRMLDLLTQATTGTYASPNWFALIYAGLDDGENWARTMQASFEERAGLLVSLKWPNWDNMRSHPFFEELVRKVGLP